MGAEVHELDHPPARKTAPRRLSWPRVLRVQHPHQINSVPDTPDWLHEIKYDGYRLRLKRDGDVCA